MVSKCVVIPIAKQLKNDPAMDTKYRRRLPANFTTNITIKEPAKPMAPIKVCKRTRENRPPYTIHSKPQYKYPYLHSPNWRPSAPHMPGISIQNRCASPPNRPSARISTRATAVGLVSTHVCASDHGIFRRTMTVDADIRYLVYRRRCKHSSVCGSVAAQGIRLERLPVTPSHAAIAVISPPRPFDDATAASVATQESR